MKRLLLTILLAALGPAAAGRSVTLVRDFGTLVGTLTEPAGGSETVALLIAGSGPTDRNGNNPQGLRTDSYRYLAESLARAGVASLRYDKRGIGASRYEHPERMAEVVFEDFVGDAAAWVDTLAAQGYRRIVLIGHSEGALVALCAAQHNPHIAAVVSLAGPGFPFDTVLKRQLAMLPLEQIALYVRAESMLNALRRGERIADVPPPLLPLFHASVQPFVISILRYDPRQLIAALRIPVLIVQGDNDLQVTLEDADALQQAQPRARKVLVEGMTHTLKPSEGRTQAEQMNAYTDSTLAPAPDLIRTLTDFFEGLRAEG